MRERDRERDAKWRCSTGWLEGVVAVGATERERERERERGERVADVLWDHISITCYFHLFYC